MKHLQDLDGVILPRVIDESEPVYLRLPIIIKDAELRNRIHDELHRQGIGASKMYINSINHYDYLKGIVPDTECPKAEYVADRILTVPTHPLVTKEDLELIVDTFRRFF
jgi:dTDP-4-amino-4,6-dideoxygalactose transaminase